MPGTVLSIEGIVITKQTKPLFSWSFQAKGSLAVHLSSFSLWLRESFRPIGRSRNDAGQDPGPVLISLAFLVSVSWSLPPSTCLLPVSFFFLCFCLFSPLDLWVPQQLKIICYSIKLSSYFSVWESRDIGSDLDMATDVIFVWIIMHILPGSETDLSV